MAANEIQTYVLLFPNQEWSDTATDIDLDNVVAQLSPNISFTQDLTEGIQTLSSQNSDRSGTANGFLYVPDLDPTDSCFNISKQYIPHNVTRQANLPPTDFTLIAIAPWISVDCTQSFLAASRSDPNRGFIFYLPNNDTTQPPPPSSSTWDLQDGGSWKDDNPYPVYAIPGKFGQQLMHQLSLYSGNMTDVPFGHDVSELPGYDPRDYIRLYTAIESPNLPTLPRFWVFILVVMAVLLAILGLISAGMHLTQRHRRNSLRRRVENREVNLEALGIKRLTVPQESIAKLPLFIYSDEGQNSQPASPAIKDSSIITTEKDNIEGLGSPRINRASSSYLASDAVRMPEEVINVEGKTPDVVLIHRFLPYPQPTCPICLDDFVCGETEIRELPCGHIFHPECIDTFLGNNSSLCPMCKQIAWPVGDCPVTITNGMVRRERNLRKLRPRVQDVEASAGLKNTWGQLSSRLKKRLSTAINDHPSQELSTIPETSHPPSSTILPARPQSSALGNNETYGDSEPARAEFLAARIRELASRQTPIQDPDTESRRQPPKWRSFLSRAFPGF